MKLSAAFAQDEELGVISLSVSPLYIRYQFSKSFKKTDPMLTPESNWHTESAYPLICVTNKILPKQAYIYHTLEKDLTGAVDQAGLVKFNLPGKLLMAGTEIRDD